MAKLHLLDIGAAAAAGIPALTAEQLRARVRQRMDDCHTLAPVPEKLWGLWQKWIDGDAFWPDFAALSAQDGFAANSRQGIGGFGFFLDSGL